MARYISDQNKIVLRHESGTYASASGNGIWIGQVTDSSVSDAENVLVNRYLGTASRSWGSTEPGPRDVTGTLTFNAQDMRIPFFAIGSVFDVSGTASQHTATQVNTDTAQSGYTSGTLNPPFSFTLEDSKQAPGTGKNFVRTINGVVPTSVTLTASQGEKVVVSMDYIGQTLTFSSGTTTSVTEPTNRPYLWSDSLLTLAGSVINTAKEVSLEINQNMEPPHYLNGSRDISVPFPQNREYTLSVTMDMDADSGNLLYDDLYKSNGSFNATFALNASTSAGSQEAFFVFSGCRIVETPDIPSPNEGVNEVTFSIMPQNVTGSSIDSSTATATYNPW